MKNIFLRSMFLGVLATSSLASCSDEFLNEEPATQVSQESAILTEADMQLALNGAYRGLNDVLVSGSTVTLYGRNLPVAGDLLADNVFVSTRNSGRYFAFNQYTFTQATAEVSEIWSSSYQVILRANNIINATGTTGTVANIDQYKGEAYAVRALAYFNLVRTYAKPYTDDPSSPGVPIVLTYDPTLKPSRSTVQEVYTQIENDLVQAYQLQTLYRGSSYFSKYAARALAANVALYKADYANALAYAKDVIDNSGFSLLNRADVASYWASGTPNASSVKRETLFEVAVNATNNAGFDELSNIYNPAGYGGLLATPELYTSYSDDDVRKSLILNTTRSSAENPAYVINKYPIVTGAGDVSDKKVIRMSEVYLIAAEAANRTNNDVTALTYLNALASRRYTAQVFASTGSALLEDIITERRKELAFEGNRWFDLNRLMRPITRSTQHPAASRSIPYPGTTTLQRFFPIPESERNVNPNI